MLKLLHKSCDISDGCLSFYIPWFYQSLAPLQLKRDRKAKVVGKSTIVVSSTQLSYHKRSQKKKVYIFELMWGRHWCHWQYVLSSFIPIHKRLINNKFNTHSHKWWLSLLIHDHFWIMDESGQCPSIVWLNQLNGLQDRRLIRIWSSLCSKRWLVDKTGQSEPKWMVDSWFIN